MKRAVAIAALAAACSLRAPRVSEPPCNVDAQCGSGRVCFANECRSPSAALRSAMVEVTPPNSSPWAPAQRALDLSASAVAVIELPEPFAVDGTLVQDNDLGGVSPVGGAALEFRESEPLIPGRALAVTLQTGATGDFAARLPPTAWQLRVKPPAPLPPFVPPGVVIAAASGMLVRLPAASRLTRLGGSLRIGALPLAGARVTPVDRAGAALGSSTTTDAEGRFALVLPPPPVEYGLRIGEASEAATLAGGPIPSFRDDAFGFRLAGTAAAAADVALPALPPPGLLTGRVVDDYKKPVSRARVLAKSLDGAGWVLTRSTLTADDGTFALALRQGKYVIEAVPAPEPEQPALSEEKEVSIGGGGSANVELLCPPRLLAIGRVLRSDGRPLGAGASVTATRLPDRLLASRAAVAATTDAAGVFKLTIEPGTYRIEVVPTADSGQPRQISYAEIPASDAVELDAIQLSPPLVLAGSVRGRSGSTVAGATVDVYSVNTAGDAAVHLGSAITDPAGRFRVVVPDVPAPGAKGLR